MRARARVCFFCACFCVWHKQIRENSNVVRKRERILIIIRAKFQRVFPSSKTRSFFTPTKGKRKGKEREKETRYFAALKNVEKKNVLAN